MLKISLNSVTMSNFNSLIDKVKSNLNENQLVYATISLIGASGLAFRAYRLRSARAVLRTRWAKLRDDRYWGPAVKSGLSPSTAIRPFKIEVPNSELEDLRVRLQRTRLADSFDNTGFNYGMRSDVLKLVIDYWLNKYDWRQEEVKLNQFNHFKTEIEGLDIHYFHAKPGPGAKTVIPIMMVHGWPSSVVEYLKTTEILTQPDQDGLAFEVICPSLPGYGWSSPAARPGLNQLHTARIFVKLMERLGHQRFYYQAGDWGAIVGKNLAALFPERVRGASLQILSAPRNGSLPMFLGMYLNQPKLWSLLQQTGYMHIMGTKPDTIGVGLGDSPAGLAAWILEKFLVYGKNSKTTTDLSSLDRTFSMDDLLTNVMIYWLNGSATSSSRFYKEWFSYECQVELKVDELVIPSSVPVGVTLFPHEVIPTTEGSARRAARNVVRFTKMDRGGHFGAFQEPQLLTNEIRAFVKQTLT